MISMYLPLVMLILTGVFYATVKLESKITSLGTTLTNVGLGLSLVLIILAAIVFGISQTMPSESRGKWVSIAVGLLIGGVVMAAIIGASTMIRESAYESLQQVGPSSDNVPVGG